MSLENEIKSLNDTIKELIATLNKAPLQLELPFEVKGEVVSTEVKKEKTKETVKDKTVEKPAEKEVKEETKSEEKPVNPSDLQAKCLELVRKDNSNKGKIKLLFKNYDATIIADLTRENMIDFAKKLGEL